MYDGCQVSTWPCFNTDLLFDSALLCFDSDLPCLESDLPTFSVQSFSLFELDLTIFSSQYFPFFESVLTIFRGSLLPIFWVSPSHFFQSVLPFLGGVRPSHIFESNCPIFFSLLFPFYVANFDLISSSLFYSSWVSLENVWLGMLTESIFFNEKLV